MDIESNLYYWVTEALAECAPPSDVLHAIGFDLNDRPSYEISSLLRNPLWVLEGNSKRRLSGDAELVHSTRFGWRLYLSDASLKSLPALLTTDASLRLGYKGYVELLEIRTGREVAFNELEMMPLIADEWIGVAAPEDNIPMLCAYTSRDVLTPVSCAYSPWTGAPNEDPDAPVYKVSLKPDLCGT
jgi:hypothetical protein